MFCWVPGHCGIYGNEQADIAAKEAQTTRVRECLLPPSDLRPCLHAYVINKWQAEWDQCEGNELHEINPEIGKRLVFSFKRRWDQIVFTRCRIGHSRLTHAFLLKGEEPPSCDSCSIPLTVKHILLNCPAFNATRQQFYSESSMKDVFNNVSPEIILDLLSQVHLKHLI
uniref:RNase H type-1 domain-containing protein n=1 Tax=Anguilla anguilla TaxID=7936 RepID=A0A0E9X648_ANGAN